MSGNLRDLPGYSEVVRSLNTSAQQAQQSIDQQANKLQADLAAQRERELRKRDLPITRPSPQILANIAANQESVKQQAEAAKADIEKQRTEQQAEIDRQAQAILEAGTEQPVTPVSGWTPQDVYNYYRENGGVATTPSFETNYQQWKQNKTPFPAIPETGVGQFQLMQLSGQIPEDAIYLSYDRSMGAVTYEMPEDLATRAEAARIEANLITLAPYGTTYATAKEALDAGAITMSEYMKWKNIELFPAGREGYAPITTYDLSAALKAGISENILINAGFDKKDIDGIKAYDKIITNLKPYTDKEGKIDVATALKDKAVTTADLRLVGISDNAIKQAEHYAAIGKIRTYWEGMTPWTEWKGEKVTAAGIGEMAAVTLLPGVWAKDWNQMTPTWRAINIAIDVAFLIPFVGWAGKAIKVASIGAKATKALRVTAKSARVAGGAQKAFTTSLKTLKGAEIGTKEYARLSSEVQHLAFASRKADLAFADNIMKLTSITPKQLTKLEKMSGMTGLKQAVIDVSDAQKALSKAWKGVDKFKLGTNDYLKQLYEAQKAQTGLDKMLGRFDAVMRPREKLGITTDFDKILHPVKEVEGYRMKWIEPGKADAEKTIAELEDFLYKRRGEMPGIQQPLFPAGGGKGKVAIATAEKVKPKVKVAPSISKLKLEPKYKPEVKPEGAKVKAPSVFPGIKAKPKVYAGKAPEGMDFAAAAEIARMPAAARERAMREALKEAGITTYVTARVVAATRRITDTKQLTTTLVVTTTAIQNAIKAATQGATQVQIESQVKAALQPLTRILPATKLQTLTNTIVKTAAKTTAKTTPKVTPRIVPKLKIPVPPIPLPGGGALELTREQLEGIIAWKQGIMYKMIYPPYGQKQIVNSRKPLAGVHYYSGVGSALKSIIARGGRVPKEILRDMGIMDLRIVTPPGSRKPTIHFKRDIYQRTRTTPQISTVR